MASKYPNSGILGKNERMRPQSQDPNLAGSAEVDGVEYWIAGWTKIGKDGSKFISMTFKRKDAAQAAAPKKVAELDEDIPW